MVRRLRILLLPVPVKKKGTWQTDVIRAIETHHDLVMYSEHGALDDQFRGVDDVVDVSASRSQRELADAAARVKLWQLVSTGYDHFDLEYWTHKKIRVANCPGENAAIAVAECALMFMQMLSRHWSVSQTNLRKGIL